MPLTALDELRNKGEAEKDDRLVAPADIGAGILPEHLAVTNICTGCNPDLLFSHRASKGKRGNLGAFLFIRA